MQQLGLSGHMGCDVLYLLSGRIPIRLHKTKSNVLRPAHHDVTANATTRVVTVVDHTFGDHFVDRVAITTGYTIARLEIAGIHLSTHHGRILGRKVTFEKKAALVSGPAGPETSRRVTA